MSREIWYSEQENDVVMDVTNMVVRSVGRHRTAIGVIPGTPFAVPHILSHPADKQSTDRVGVGAKDVAFPLGQWEVIPRDLCRQQITQPQEVPVLARQILDKAVL